MHHGLDKEVQVEAGGPELDKGKQGDAHGQGKQRNAKGAGLRRAREDRWLCTAQGVARVGRQPWAGQRVSEKAGSHGMDKGEQGKALSHGLDEREQGMVSDHRLDFRSKGKKVATCTSRYQEKQADMG